jgi:drug/metabolite transporter (DMT)-like permease
MDRRRLNGYLISILAAAAWAGTSPGIAYLQRLNVPSLAIAFWRDVFVAVAIFGVFAAVRPALLRVTRETFIGLLISGAVSIGLYHVLWVYSVRMNGPAVAVVLVYTYNAFTALGARLVFKEPMRRAQTLALVISLVGLVLVVKAYDPSTWAVTWQGTAIGVLSALLQTVYVLYNQRFIKSVNPLVSLGYQMAFGAVVIGALILLFDPGQMFGVGAIENWLLLVFLGIGPTLGGYGFFNLAMRFVPGKVAGLISVMEVPFAAGLAWLIFGDTLILPQYAGMALVLAASVAANGVESDSG